MNGEPGLHQANPPNTAVGVSSQKKKRMFVSWLLVVILVGAVGVSSYYYLSHRKSYVFVIEGTGYTKSQVKPAVDFEVKNFKKSQADASKDIFELTKYKAAAEKLGISPTQSDLDSHINTLNLTYTTNQPKGIVADAGYKSWVSLTAFKMTVQESLLVGGPASGTAAATPINYRGYSYIFWFGNHEDYTSEYTPPGGYGVQTLIDQDKSYAQAQANNYRDKLNKNQLTADQVLQDVQNDAKLGFEYKAKSNLSAHFGVKLSVPWQQDVYYKTVIDYITKHPQPQVSEVQVGKISAQPTPGAPIVNEDAYYYFVKIEGNAPTAQQFNDTLNALKTTYSGVKS